MTTVLLLLLLKEFTAGEVEDEDEEDKDEEFGGILVSSSRMDKAIKGEETDGVVMVPNA